MIVVLGAPSGPIAPAWAILPIGFLALLAIGVHVLAVMRSDMPPSRKRIRTANGLLMMFTTPLLAFAFSMLNPGTQPKLFAMAWILCVALCVLILGLACFDILNNVRLYRAEQRQIRREAAAAREKNPRPLRVAPPSSDDQPA